jgi:hypothetical protein
MGVSEGRDLLWARVERRLHNAESYWLATTRPDGRPHCVPVWGVWANGSLWFWTSPTSVKGRNLAADAHAVVHLESADDVVILEGEVEQVDDPGLAAPVLAAYAAKYPDFDIDSPQLGEPHRLWPRVAHAWLEGLLLETRTRWEPLPRRRT